jgi:hypothetical protein
MGAFQGRELDDFVCLLRGGLYSLGDEVGNFDDNVIPFQRFQTLEWRAEKCRP